MRTVVKLLIANREGQVPLARITASIQGWVNHLRYGNTVGLRKAVLWPLLKDALKKMPLDSQQEKPIMDPQPSTRKGF